MRSFDYTSPTAVADVIELLDANANVRPLAGGTDLLTLMKADLAAPDQLINIKQLEDLPRGIEETDGGLSVGALTTLSEIETSDVIRKRFRALAEAVSLAATPQLRNMATLGGNLLQRPRCWYFRNAQFNCWLKGGDECPARDGENQLHAIFDASPCVAVHPSDPAAALLALGASVRLRGRGGERTVPLDEFFAAPDDARRTENTLAPDELVLSIEIPAQPGGTRSTYLKAMDRKVWAFALVGVAATLQVENGTITAARLVLSGVANTPHRVTAAEDLLVGAKPSEEMFAQAADAALADAVPLEQNGYKVQLAKALVRRALAAIA